MCSNVGDAKEERSSTSIKRRPLRSYGAVLNLDMPPYSCANTSQCKFRYMIRKNDVPAAHRVSLYCNLLYFINKIDLCAPHGGVVYCKLWRVYRMTILRSSEKN